MKNFKKLITRTLSHLALSILIFQSFIFADVPYGTKINNSIKNIQSMMVETSYNFLSRDMDAYIANNGLVLDYHPRGDSALMFKEVSSVFQASIWAAGRVDGQLRAIVGDYTQDMGPGPYGQNPLDESYKIYYVSIEMFTSPGDYDDFQNWPVNQGAPYVDVNGNGIYEPLPSGDDYPQFIGDKVAFFVANDGDPAYKLNFGTAPMNLEMQFLIYSFDQPVSEYLAQSLFYKVLVINKGSEVIEQTYFGVFFDDDLGNATDDLVGVSVDRGLGYSYNDGDDSFMSGAGISPFVKGSDFLQGPMIDCITGGSVTFNLSASDSNGDTLVYQLSRDANNGSVNCDSATGSCTYTPNSGFTGSDSFTYFVHESGDANRQSNIATVTINVQASRGEIGIDNLMITSASKKGLLPHPNSPELVTAMKEIKFEEHDHHHDHNHDGYVRCATDELEKELQLINPEFVKKRDEFLDQVKKNKEQFRTEKRTTVEIPVIFHVLYFDDDDNISNGQISQNFDQLNDDFKLENADKDSIPSIANKSDAPFDSSIDYSHHDVRGAHDVNFVGFNGETKGTVLDEGFTVRRYKINQETVSGVSEASSLASSTATDSGIDGGYQAGYLNIYIAPLTGGLLGQAYIGFPEAVVLGSTVGSLDSPGTASGFNRGRTLTHEIGHNFSFNHVFNSSSCSDQEWSDIPPQTTNNRSATYYTYALNEYGNFDDENTDQKVFNNGEVESSTFYNGLNSDIGFYMFGAKGKAERLGSNGGGWSGLNDYYISTYGSAGNELWSNTYEYSSANRTIAIGGENSLTISLSNSTSFLTNEVLLSDKIYHLRVSRKDNAQMAGKNVDPAYDFESTIEKRNGILLDETAVRPSHDYFNSSNYYDYYFFGKDEKLTVSINNADLNSQGSFEFVLTEMNDHDSSSYYTGVASDSLITVIGNTDINYLQSYMVDVFQGREDANGYSLWNDVQMNRSVAHTYDANNNLIWTFETDTDSTAYKAYNNLSGQHDNFDDDLGTFLGDVVRSNTSDDELIIFANEYVNSTGTSDTSTLVNLYAYVLDRSTGNQLNKKLIYSTSANKRVEQAIANNLPGNGGGYFLITSDYGSNGGSSYTQPRLVKLDNDLDPIWSVFIDRDGSYASKLDHLVALPDNQGVLVGGGLSIANVSPTYRANGYIALFDQDDGEKKWANHQVNIDAGIDDFYGIIPEVGKDSTSITPEENYFLAVSRAEDDDYRGIQIQRIKISDGSIHSTETLSETGDFYNEGFYGWGDIFYANNGYYGMVGQSRASTNNEYYSDPIHKAVYNFRAVNLVENTYGGGKDAVNSCISTSGQGDQFMNYMDYVDDDQMRMFSAEQALDGYSWASSRDWFNDTNILPVANDVTLDATVNEDCSEGAKMFGQRHPGKKNLQMTSYSFFINGDATYTDPIDETEAYNYMQGLRKDGSAYPTEIAGDLYDQKFAFYGDPNDTAGHSSSNPIDGNYAAPADRRTLMNVGPFTMAPGDSQEIVFNVMMASGTESLNALSNLFTANDSTQVWYDSDFEILEETNEIKNIEVSATATEGFAPFTSTFSLNSTYQFLTYNWDFDNDGTVDSKSLNPTHTFTEAGTYTVSAKAFYNFYENGTFFMKESADSLTVTVLDNSAITISTDSLTTNEDTSLSSELTISNPSNRSYALQLGLTPSNGIVSFNNATMNYTPNKNFNGLDSLKVFAKDGAYESDEALIKINVLPIDDTPVTADVAVSTNEDTAVAVYLTASEYDGDTYEFEIKEHPAYGSLSSILSSAGVDSVIYTPDTDWFGTDQFKFEASDSSSRMNLGTAVIQVLPVNDAPITEDVTVDTYEDVVTPITLSFSDVDNDQISIILTSPNNGTVELSGSYVEYIPNSNFWGDDSFNYYVSDGTEQSNVSNVTVNIESVNDASSDFSVGDTYIVDSTAGEEWVVTTNSLVATKENEEDSLQFNWNESFDIDGDKIQYRMVGYNDLEFLTMDDWITDLTLSWSIKDLVANTDTVNVAKGSWIIVASDGEFFVESNFGNPMELSINGSALIPDQYSLNQNYPNPFKNFTTISFDMPENQKVKIRIFDVRGRIIRTLINEDQSAGFKSILWDGKNEDGDEVSAGVYFYQMYAPSSANFKGISKSKRMVKFD